MEVAFWLLTLHPKMTPVLSVPCNIEHGPNRTVRETKKYREANGIFGEMNRSAVSMHEI